MGLLEKWEQLPQTSGRRKQSAFELAIQHYPESDAVKAITKILYFCREYKPGKVGAQLACLETEVYKRQEKRLMNIFSMSPNDEFFPDRLCALFHYCSAFNFIELIEDVINWDNNIFKDLLIFPISGKQRLIYQFYDLNGD